MKKVVLLVMTKKGFEVIKKAIKSHKKLIDFIVIGSDKSVQNDYSSEIVNLVKESGVDLSLLRKIIIPSVGLISGVVSVYCGPVIFIGLMAPHLTRMIFLTSNHRILIPASFLLGAGLCLLVTLFSNGYFIGFSVPINALLGLLGTPFVLVLLVRSSFSNGGGGYV